MMNVNYLILVFLSFEAANCFNECCNSTDNVITEENTCQSDYFVGLLCTDRYLVGPESRTPEIIKIEEDGNLTVYTDDGETNYSVPFELYCLAQKGDNGSMIALVCKQVIVSSWDLIHWDLTGVCSLITILFLILTFAFYFFIPYIRSSIEGKCILSLLLALIVYHLATTIYYFMPEPIPNCAALTLSIYTSLLIAHFWLNIIAFQTWKSIVHFQNEFLNSQKRWFWAYCFYAYGASGLFLATVLSEQIVNDLTECWFQGAQALWIFVIGPLLILTIINILLYIWIVKRLWFGENRQKVNHSTKTLRYKCLIYIHLTIILTVSWICVVFSESVSDEEDNANSIFWALIDWKNNLQGILIFCLLVVIRRRVLKEVVDRKLCCVSLPEKWALLRDEETDYSEQQ